MATTIEISQWAQGIGLPVCIGTEFNAEIGRLPISLIELVSWGNNTGRRNEAGRWRCITGSMDVSGLGGNGSAGAIGIVNAQGIMAWIQQNPILAFGAGFLLVWAVKGHK